MKRSLRHTLAILGPGFAVAATGVGAGDVVAAAVTGARLGAAVLWVAVVGAVVKFALNEGIARWQLATGTTLLEGWARHLHRAVLFGFGAYLVLWTVMVAAALMAACGLAAHAMVPGLSVAAWGAIHSVVALVLVVVGRYALFERMMKGFIALMFVTVVVSAVLVRPDLGAILQGLVLPRVPAGSGRLLLGVIGGVGGSVTLLSYSYWMRERGWSDAGDVPAARLDLGAAYVLTGLFGVAIMIVAAGARPGVVQGNGMALALADRIGTLAGPAGRWVFLAGFWGAVFTSMMGVWQGVPYLFADVVQVMKHRAAGAETLRRAVDTTSPSYRGYLLFIALPPMALLLVGRPVWLILVYAVAGAFFMPFLAGTLLYLNNRKNLVAALKNGRLVNVALGIALVLFAYLCYVEIAG